MEYFLTSLGFLFFSFSVVFSLFINIQATFFPKAYLETLEDFGSRKIKFFMLLIYFSFIVSLFTIFTEFCIDKCQI